MTNPYTPAGHVPDPRCPNDEPGGHERWLPVADFPSYEVSDQGRVRRLAGWILTRRGYWTPIRGRVLHLKTAERYNSVILHDAGRTATRRVHRLVLTTFVGDCPDGMEGCHNNGNARDNRLSNLRWDTPLANCDDIRKHGTHHHTAQVKCKRRHVLAPPNIRPDSLRRGQRACLACNRGGDRLRYHYKTTPTNAPELMQQVSDRYYEEIMNVVGEAA